MSDRKKRAQRTFGEKTWNVNAEGLREGGMRNPHHT